MTIIAPDWGTSSLRAYLLDATGAILGRHAGGPGIMKVENGAFEAALEAFCGDWMAAHPQAPLIASFMTGEVYAALVGHTILGRLMKLDAKTDPAAFERGVAYGLEAPGALLSRIFSARTLGLFGTLADSALPAYLSGLLIGSEIGGALQMQPCTASPVLLGASELTALYARALRLAGVEAHWPRGLCGGRHGAHLARRFAAGLRRR